MDSRDIAAGSSIYVREAKGARRRRRSPIMIDHTFRPPVEPDVVPFRNNPRRTVICCSGWRLCTIPGPCHAEAWMLVHADISALLRPASSLPSLPFLPLHEQVLTVLFCSARNLVSITRSRIPPTYIAIVVIVTWCSPIIYLYYYLPRVICRRKSCRQSRTSRFSHAPRFTVIAQIVLNT